MALLETSLCNSSADQGAPPGPAGGSAASHGTRLLWRLSAALMVCSQLLGGGARTGFASDTLLQLIALPVLIVVLRRNWRDQLASPVKWELRFCLAAALLPAAQLVPLPPFLWKLLPNSGLLVESHQLAGGELPWAQLSVCPRETWLSAFAALPPLAMFLCVLQLGRRERRDLTLVLLGCGAASVFLGLMQLSDGPQSPLRFYAVTNPTEAVGFFANRNHYAALLYTLTLFAAAWAADLATTATWKAETRSRRARFKLDAMSMLAMSFTLLVALVAAQAMARSRAGLGLTMIALAGAFALAGSGKRRETGIGPERVLAGAVIVAVFFTVQFALFRILERFAADPLADMRLPLALGAIEAAAAYTPFGAGMGSFPQAYGLFEKPANIIPGFYANHAHNDVVEFWLEAGVAGLALMGAFTCWLFVKARAVWRPAPENVRAIDSLLQRAAAMAIGLLILHSLVDYPLRASAMMTVFAFACALLTEPPARPGESEGSGSGEDAGARRGRRRRSRRTGGGASRLPAGEQATEDGAAAAAAAAAADRQWLDSIEWPEEKAATPGQSKE